jgi:hypothetical protein
MMVALFIGGPLVTQAASTPPPQATIRLHAERMLLSAVLEKLSEALAADIYVATPLDTELRDLHFEDVPALQVLQNVLRGSSYAIVYRTRRAGAPVRFLAKVGSDAPAGEQPPAPVTAEVPVEAQADERGRMADREEELRGQIKEIETQLASGYADEWYEHWVKIKGPEYVIHPREHLERYTQELAALYR